MRSSLHTSAPERRRPRWQRLMALPVAAIALLGAASCTMAPPVTTTVPSVELERYLGTWFEVGSVKQFFSVGLVNTKAQYSLNSNGTVRVENSGNYFAANGPESRIVGAAAPVDSTNAKLNVSFAGPPSPNPPGNYWIVDLDADYQWAIVSDPTGTSAFLLSRTRQVSPELYAELVERAAAKGVSTANLTPTPQL
ncbi:MAG: lipocalin family protein [Microthrixaceae bacterium]